jgi:ubiquinone/menaquinone biosynthesis C-methylase UbiE
VRVVSESTTESVEDPNAETTEAWDGPLFAVFEKFREAMTPGLDAQGLAALELAPPGPGDHVLDIGCGYGDTTKQIAGMIGPEGEATGVDISPRFIEAATAEAEEAGLGWTSFRVADVQTDELGGPYDLAFSRFGTMFFANPVAALRRVRESLAPGGRLAMVVWRRREDNVWLHRTQQIVESFVQRPEEYDEPTCGPGPFSMAGADTTTDQLLAAGFEEIAMHRFDRPMRIGRDLDEALDLNLSLGPGGEILRLLGDRLGAEQRTQIEAAVREGLGEFVAPDGSVVAPASTWVVTASRPA